MFVIKSKWLVSIKSLQVLQNKEPACASVALQSVFADRSGRVATLAFCCTLRWSAPTPARPESSKKKRAAPDLRPPLKFQVLLEVTSCRLLQPEPR